MNMHELFAIQEVCATIMTFSPRGDLEYVEKVCLPVAECTPESYTSVRGDCVNNDTCTACVAPSEEDCNGGGGGLKL